MIKIAIDARWINSSGMGVYLKNIIPEIAKYYNKHEIYLLGNSKVLRSMKGLNLNNIKYIEYNCKMYSILDQFILPFIIPSNTNLYFSTHYNIPVFYKGKILVMVYDINHIVNIKFKYFHRYIYALFFFTVIGYKVCHVLTISNFTKYQYLKKFKFFNLPITVTSLASIFNLSASVFPVAKSTPPYILFVGNIKPHKNLGVLLDAFKLIKDRIPHNLLLVGKRDGFISGDSNSQLLDGAIDGRIKFAGFIPDADMPTVYRNASVFVFPSLYEGFGLPPLEAMSFDCPVISSNAASLPEVCGDAALYFDPISPKDLSDKLMLLFSSDLLRSDLVQKGRKNIRRFSWEDCATKTIEVIDSLVGT